MVLNYAQLSKKPGIFRKLTGLTLSDFAQKLEQKADNRQHAKNRIGVEHKFVQLKTFRL